LTVVLGVHRQGKQLKFWLHNSCTNAPEQGLFAQQSSPEVSTVYDIKVLEVRPLKSSHVGITPCATFWAQAVIRLEDRYLNKAEVQNWILGNAVWQLQIVYRLPLDSPDRSQARRSLPNRLSLSTQLSVS
jgi:hypothetical protein